MAQQYTLTLHNQSTMSGDFCVFQAPPDENIPGVLTLAWLSQRTDPGTTVAFSWSLDYNFVWSEQGMLKAGAKFMASQIIDADLSNYNQVSLDFDGAYKFSKPTRSQRPGSLCIMQGPTVRPNDASVGIGMSGHATFVAPSQPNMELYFTPHPRYYVVFGEYAPGAGIVVSELSESFEAQFVGTHSVSLTFNAQNLWVRNS